jgi:PHD/YefM family antitoxin component YafN of YafNO toxin-antitoxin module
MIEITQEEFESNFDAYMDRVENNKELFLIRLPDGRGVVMTPAEELEEITGEINVPEITD